MVWSVKCITQVTWSTFELNLQREPSPVYSKHATELFLLPHRSIYKKNCCKHQYFMGVAMYHQYKKNLHWFILLLILCFYDAIFCFSLYFRQLVLKMLCWTLSSSLKSTSCPRTLFSALIYSHSINSSQPPFFILIISTILIMSLSTTLAFEQTFLGSYI